MSFNSTQITQRLDRVFHSNSCKYSVKKNDYSKCFHGVRKGQHLFLMLWWIYCRIYRIVWCKATQFYQKNGLIQISLSFGTCEECILHLNSKTFCCNKSCFTIKHVLIIDLASTPEKHFLCHFEWYRLFLL